MDSDTSSGKRRGRWLISVFTVVVPWFLLALLRLSSFSGENSVDCYYHVEMADRGPGVYMGRSFPVLTMSEWTKNFSDKELGFHALLSVVRATKAKLFGVAGSEPFNAEALFFAFLLLSAFAYAALRFGASIGATACCAVLLVVGSPFFTDRVLMLRPHNLFLALVLLSFPIFDSARSIKGQWGPFLIGFAGAWCYSNPHFLLLPAAGFAVARLVRGFRGWWLVPVSVVLGVLVGYTIHPQFPHTFVNWKIQCVDVVRQALSGGAPVAIGTEFHRPGWAWILKNIVPFLAFAFVFSLLVFGGAGEGSPRERLRGIPDGVVAVAFSAFVAFLGVPLGIRAMEYAAPFAMLLLCLVISGGGSAWGGLPQALRGYRVVVLSYFLTALLALAFLEFQGYNYRHVGGIRPFRDVAKWSEDAGIPDGAVFANLVWSDFPMLWRARPGLRYLWGLDPMFSYAAFPGRIERLEMTRLGKAKPTPAELAGILGTRWAFVSDRYAKYADRLKALGCVAIYEGDDGWVFDLNAAGNGECDGAR